jgi:hypothetical protein
MLRANRQNIAWDEGNLVETSVGRGTRMKIDEPDTPYAYPGTQSLLLLEKYEF